MPASVRAPCALTTLGPNPTQADLEIGYLRRGAQLLTCDIARQTAVDVHDGEHADEDAWLSPRRVDPALKQRSGSVSPRPERSDRGPQE